MESFPYYQEEVFENTRNEVYDIIDGLIVSQNWIELGSYYENHRSYISQQCDLPKNIAIHLTGRINICDISTIYAIYRKIWKTFHRIFFSQFITSPRRWQNKEIIYLLVSIINNTEPSYDIYFSLLKILHRHCFHKDIREEVAKQVYNAQLVHYLCNCTPLKNCTESMLLYLQQYRNFLIADITAVALRIRDISREDVESYKITDPILRAIILS